MSIAPLHLQRTYPREYKESDIPEIMAPAEYKAICASAEAYARIGPPRKVCPQMWPLAMVVTGNVSRASCLNVQSCQEVPVVYLV